MKKHNVKGALTADEITTIRKARKILTKLTKKASAWEGRIESYGGSSAEIGRAVAEEAKFDKWMCELFKAGVDFRDEAFVKLD